MTANSITLSKFAGKKCLVTGGLGFIGSNMALALARGGAQVKVVDALVTTHGGDRRNLDTDDDLDIEVIISDIADRSLVAPHLEGADYVFAIAGQVSHHASMVKPLDDLEYNARSQLKFVEMIREVAPKAKVVHTSTRQVYGRADLLPVDESHLTIPVDVNGVNKLAGEQFYLIYGRNYGMSISALRLTNVYGPRQCLANEGLGFLPVFIKRALNNQPITLFGTGEHFRDCLHVDDVVQAMALAVTSKDAPCEVFNIGHTECLTLHSIAETIIEVAGQGELTYKQWPAELVGIDIGSFCSDISKAKKLLSWEPKIGLAEGIGKSIEFYRENPWYLSSS